MKPAARDRVVAGWSEDCERKVESMPRKKPTPVRYCKFCGKLLTRKRYPCGAEESVPHLLKRQFCDQVCMGKATHAAWKLAAPRPITAHTSRERARKVKQREACEKCNGTHRLHVHHRDENPMNNSEENLQVLCNSCHTKHHNPKGICTVCGMPQRCLGYCTKHLYRFKKHGSPHIRCFGRGKPTIVPV